MGVRGDWDDYVELFMYGYPQGRDQYEGIYCYHIGGKLSIQGVMEKNIQR